MTSRSPKARLPPDDTAVRVTVLDGLDRINVPFEATVSSQGADITFGEPVEAGLLVRVELQKLAPPAETMMFTMGLSYTDGSGEVIALPETPGIQIEEQGVVENIVEWLDGQPWVEAWNSNTFLRLFFNPQLAVQAVPDLFVGWLRALSLVCIGFPLAIPIGFALSFMRMSGIAIVRGIAGLYVNIVRGTPLFLTDLHLLLRPAAARYQREQLRARRGGPRPELLGVPLRESLGPPSSRFPRASCEAARSLGMTGPQTMFSVIIPQSVRRVIPTATSEFILLYKDTSLLASVGVMELMMFSKSLTASTGNITPYIVAACYYLIVTLPLTKLIGTFERRLAAADGVRPDNDDPGDLKGGGKASIEAVVAAANAGDVTPIVIQNDADRRAADARATAGGAA